MNFFQKKLIEVFKVEYYSDFPSFFGRKKMLEIYSLFSVVLTFSMILHSRNLSISLFILSCSSEVNFIGFGI